MTVINEIICSVPTYYVKNPLKIKKSDKANAAKGAATLYLSTDIGEFPQNRTFFNSFDPTNEYIIPYDSIINYLYSVKFEYILNLVPPSNKEYNGQVNLEYWEEKMGVISGLNQNYFSNLSVEEHISSTPERQNIRTSGNGFSTLREILVPDITQIRIKREQNQQGGFTYKFIPELRSDFSLNTSTISDDVLLIDPDTIGKNLILYGAPGTGKSYEIDRRFPNNSNRIRVNFHPEYTYYDFVGSYRPEPLYKIEQPLPTFKKNDGTIHELGEPYVNYTFVPGPFTLILEKALNSVKNDDSEMFTLIIEELNRANAPAVFGDLFQLLDREPNGESTYAITNLELLRYLKSTGSIDPNVNEIQIPSNLNIVATMNSADQGVFIMDSAFKRRWIFEYLPIEPDKAVHKNDIIEYNKRLITWANFVKGINTLLSRHAINEDKHIGPYFLKPGETSDTQLVASKILLYLWDDVARHKRERLFIDGIHTFSDLVSKFKSGEAVLKAEFTFEETEPENQEDEQTEESIDTNQMSESNQDPIDTNQVDESNQGPIDTDQVDESNEQS